MLINNLDINKLITLLYYNSFMKKFIIILLAFFINMHTEIILIDDPEIEDFLNDIIQKIYTTIGSNKKPKVHIIQNDSINAFATFDDHIFVYTGLFTKLDNALQLFSVLAHEVGHIVENHIARKVGYVKKLNIFLPFLINEYMHLSSSEEKVADLFAINIISKNQYSLQEFKKVMQKFLQNEMISYTKDVRENFLHKLDHPSSESRITVIEDCINNKKYKTKPFDSRLEQKFKRIKLKLFGFLKNEQEFFLLKLKVNASKDDINYGNAILQKKLSNFDTALSILNDLIKKEPYNYYFLTEKADTLFRQGNSDQAINILRSILNHKKSLQIQLFLANIILSKMPQNNAEIKSLINELKSLHFDTASEEYDINQKLISCYTLIENEPMRLLYIAKNLYLEMCEEALYEKHLFAKETYITKIKSILLEALKKAQNNTIKEKINSFLTYILNTK